MGSRLFAIVVLMMGIRQVPLVAQVIEMSKTNMPAGVVTPWLMPVSTYIVTAILFLTAYVMWVHAGWMSKLLTDSNAPETSDPSSWSALVYRGVSLYVVFTTIPAALGAYLRSNQENPNPGASIEFIVYCGMIVMAFAMMIGSERLSRFISNVGPGPSEPDER